MIDFDTFSKVELKIAGILEVSRVEGSEKLLKLRVSLGDEERQILAGIGRQYSPESLVGKNIVVVSNLEPRMIMGLESQGMVLAALDESGLPVVMLPERAVSPGGLLR
ncbi:MAG: methionine--tRNA ligase subunit beta [Candidatus Colwellbacteria bacterium]|nr:methionine--tRNA ligase subunit beta [Candidatus Colwellbacteria bacterium]